MAQRQLLVSPKTKKASGFTSSKMGSIFTKILVNLIKILLRKCLCLYKNKKPYLAVVYNPILDELYTAKIGKGAFLNGKKLKVSHENDFQKSLLATGFPYTSGTNENDLNDVIKKIKTILPLCQDLRRLGSAALDLCYVARGVYQGYYEMNLKPWDVSAGVLILTEAGGMVSNIKGEEYRLFEDKYLVASNGIIHEEFIKNLNL